MILTLKIKLQPDAEQKQWLLETMEAFNAACNYISDLAFEHKTASQIRLHGLCYYDVREKFGLSAQLTIRAIGKVADTYKRDKNKHHGFKMHGAVVYDHRLWKFRQADTINLKTLQARIDIPIVFCNYRELDLRRVRGQADLVYKDGKFYFYICVEVPEPPETDPKDYIGVDLGIKNIAVDSDGKIFSASHVNNLRSRQAKLRSRLQSKSTNSAKRLLKKRRRKEGRFANDVNHVISKRIVEKAKDTKSGIALENLKGIRKRTTVQKAQRRQHSSWNFHDLRTKIEYKAKLATVPVVLIDPRYTSQECSNCGDVSKSNRRSQSTFSCTSCGFSANADVNAALNIRSRAVVSLPDAVRVEAETPKQLLLLAD